MLLVAVAVAVPGQAQGASGTQITFQGRAVDAASGNPKAGPLNMSFRIFADQAGTPPALWTESHSAVPVTNGLFEVVLGGSATDPKPLDVRTDGQSGPVFDGSDRFLEVQVLGETSPLPLVPITSAGFAMNAALLGGRPASDFLQTSDTGNVGIRTTGFPRSRLTIQGDGTQTSGLSLLADSVIWDLFSDPGGRLKFLSTGGASVVIRDDGKMGVGVSDPSSPLTVASVGGDPRNIRAVGATTETGITLENNSSGGGRFSVFATGETSSFGRGKLVVMTEPTLTNRFTIRSDGNVGIGLLDPQEKLSVHGNVQANNFITSPDFAEALDVIGSRNDYGIGDVLVIGADGRLELSSEPRSRSLAGVHSASPGVLGTAHGPYWELDPESGSVETAAWVAKVRTGQGDPYEVLVLLGVDATGRHVQGSHIGLSGAVYSVVATRLTDEGDTELRLDRRLEASSGTLRYALEERNQVFAALLGVVSCKVTTEGGALRPGDLLVTSSTLGHAMRDDDPGVGMVIGRALDPLEDDGTGSVLGLIRVLVTLQ
ncbi:MAG: hypothetical protein HY722_14435 [Planctomycetes bacterium]|nr:hypothetical protein [Planctomycetota bacterium]